MASRFYLPKGGSAPPDSPAFSAGWEKTSSAGRQILQRSTPSNTALGNRGTAGNGTNPNDVLCDQFVSPALDPQTISAAATVKGQILCNESSNALNAAPNMRLYVYRPSDSSVVGVLIEMLSGGNNGAPPEFVLSTSTNRKFPRSWTGSGQVVAGAVTTQSGDVLVLELGFGVSSTSVTTGILVFGDPTAGVDLAEDETTTSNDRPWIEISQTILYSGEGAVTETPGPGGATADGRAATAKTVVPQGAATGAGAAATAASAAPQGGAVGSGVAAPAKTVSAQGGGTVGGFAPAESFGSVKQTGTARVSLASGGDPGVDTGHKLIVLARITSADPDCTVRLQLFQGAVQIGATLETSALSSSFTQTTFTLGTLAASTITDYSNLEVRFWGYSPDGTATTFEVDQIWMELPPSVGSGDSLTIGGATAQGFAPTAAAAVTAGGALAAGTPFTSGLLPKRAAAGLVFLWGDPEPTSPAPGRAVAGGFAPTAVIAPAVQGGGTATGLQPQPTVPVAAGGVPAQGRAPSESAAPNSELVHPGGAIADGQPFGATATVTIGGGAAGGQAVTVAPPLTIGGATALGKAPTATVTMTIGGAIALGPQQTDTGSSGGAVISNNDDYAALVPVLV